MYRGSVAATGTLALGAFTLSFVALRHLAIIAGIRSELAPILPVVIDLAIGVATLALVAIGDKPARRVRTAARGAGPAVASRTLNPASGRDLGTPPDGPAPEMKRDSTTAPVSDSASHNADSSTYALAGELIAQKVTRQPVEVVADILGAHDAGDQ